MTTTAVASRVHFHSQSQFKNFSPDVAFLDVKMPRLGGLDVLQVIPRPESGYAPAQRSVPIDQERLSRDVGRVIGLAHR